MRLQKQVAVLGDMNFVYAFAFVSLVGFNQSRRDRIPPDRLFGRSIKNFRRPGAENHWARSPFGELPEKARG